LKRVNIATVDVEDWFHILDHAETESVESWKNYPRRVEIGLRKILDLFDKYSVKGTFFILGWIADEYPDLVQEIYQKGHEIGSHSYAHQLVYKQTSDEFRDDLMRAEEAIERATGTRPKFYRAPGFSITKQSLFALRILIERNYLADCSVFPARRAHGGLPQFTTQKPCRVVIAGVGDIIEFPINTTQIFGKKFIYSGGGYFRLFPEFAVKYLFKSSLYNMSYFHPRDFDPDQPVLSSLSKKRKFKSYYNLAGTEAKLDKLLSVEEFISLGSYLSKIEVNTLRKIQIDDV